MEVADLIGSVAARWADGGRRAREDRSRPRRARRRDVALLGLFPAGNSIPPSWRGYSLIAHRGNYTGKEVIYSRIDQWLLSLLYSR